MKLKYQFNDGGRSASGYQGKTGDCVTRAIAIATGKPYQEVYDAINELAKSERTGKRKRGISSARNGVYKTTYHKYLTSVGWRWTPTMAIGSGCKVHLADDELPEGRLIVSLSKHVVAIIDGVIHDTGDPRREVHTVEPDYGQPLKTGQWRNQNGICSVSRRCVYGYWQPA